MNRIYVLLIVVLAAFQLSVRAADHPQNSIGLNRAISYEPAMLFTNGHGKFLPISGSQMVRVGGLYVVIPVPAPGYKFSNWQKVNAFLFTEYTVDGLGNPNPPIKTYVLSPVPTYNYSPILIYKVTPEMVLNDVPSVITIIEAQGWMANFVPIKKLKR